MRTQNTLFVFILAFALGSSNAWGQASQYQRSKKKEKAEAPAPGTVTSTTLSPQGEAKPGAPNSEKVDISDLEQKYWAPKDVEFSVVQNRLYSKAHRFAFTPQVGPLVTDSFSSGMVYGFSGNYYFSERYGAEIHFDKYDLHNSQVTEGFINDNGTVADFNRLESFYGASFNWIPIYAKLSLLEKKILYFDMSVSPGLGMMKYYQMRDNNQGAHLTSMAFTLDIAQHYFLSKEFALRVDMRNRFYNDKVVKYRTGEFVKDKGNQSITVQFGFTYYFGSGGQ